MGDTESENRALNAAELDMVNGARPLRSSGKPKRS